MDWTGAVTNNILDNRLILAIRQGAGALPADLERLHGYVRMIDTLLAEKSRELETTLEAVDLAAAEIETLHRLGMAVAERAIGIRAESLAAVREKLAIWRALAPGVEDADLASPRNRLILSVEADLERLARANY